MVYSNKFKDQLTPYVDLILKNRNFTPEQELELKDILNSIDFRMYLVSMRKSVEGVNEECEKTWRNIENFRQKTLDGIIIPGKRKQVRDSLPFLFSTLMYMDDLEPEIEEHHRNS